jgi:CrcB protein
MLRLFFCAVGGMFGALLRYKIIDWAYHHSVFEFPWGTLGINLAGSFMIGFLWGVFEGIAIPSDYKVFVLVGFLGSFTTFSTLAFENFQLFRHGEILSAVFYLLSSNVIGITLVFVGYLLSQYTVSILR